VLINGEQATVESWATHSVMVTVPAGEPGPATVKVIPFDASGQPLGASQVVANGDFSYDAMSLSSIDPSIVRVGEAQFVTIHGANFGADPGTVTIDGQDASVSDGGEWTQQEISAFMPGLPAGTYDVTVQAANGATVTLPAAMTVLAHATVTSVSPSTLPSGGGFVTINGSNFGTQPGQVLVNGRPEEIESWSDQSLSVGILNGMPGSATIVVEPVGPAGTPDSALEFTSDSVFSFALPTIDAVGPQTLPTTGGNIVIRGDNFGAGVGEVLINGVKAPTTAWSDQGPISATVPPGEPGPANVEVLPIGPSGLPEIGREASTRTLFSYAAPTLDSISPDTVAAGSPAFITITGSNFGSNPGVVSIGSSNLFIGGVPGTSWTDNKIVEWIPVSAQSLGSVNVGVAANGVLATNVLPLHFTANPVITSITPSHLPTTGGPITITGTGLDPLGKAQGSVTINGQAADRPAGATWSDTSITVTARPSDPGPATVALDVATTSSDPSEVTSTATLFSYDDPVITAVDPATLLTSQTPPKLFTVTGTNFGLAGQVLVNGVPASPNAAGTEWTQTQIVAVLPPLSLGPNSVTVVSNGRSTTVPGVITLLDTNNDGGGPTPLTLTHTVASVDVAHPVTGQPLTVTATVSAPGNPTGTVEFTSGGSDLPGCAAVPLGASGTAQCTVSGGLAAGSYPIATNYSGDSSFGASSNVAPLTVTVTPAATSTTLSPDNTALVTGQPLMLTATVAVTSPGSPGVALPGGTIAFQAGGVNLAGCGSVAVDDTGTATCTAKDGFNPSTQTLAASYSGDANFAGSNSANLSEKVTAAATIVNVTASANPPVAHQAVTYTAVVAPVAPGAGTPTGSATFTVTGPNKAAVSCTGSNTVTLSGGTATCVVPATKVVAGSTFAVTVAYAGNANFLASSGSLTATGAQAATTVALASSANPSTSRAAVTITATVAPKPPATGTPAGTVTFTIAGQHGARATCIGFDTVRLASGKAHCVIAAGWLAAANGPYTVTARYSGSPTFASSTGTLNQQVSKAATTTKIQALPARFVAKRPVTFAAIVTASPANPAPITGAATFTVTDGNGHAVACSASGSVSFRLLGTYIRVSWCTAKAGVLTPTGGPYRVVASYAGDSNNAASTATLTYTTK
jgi:hypothetical protein